MADSPFLAHLNILALSDGDHSYFEVSQDVFYNFMQVFKSKNCDHHHQSIQIDGITIIENGKEPELWGAVAQWSKHLQLKQEALGSIPSGCPGFFLFQLAY